MRSILFLIFLVFSISSFSNTKAITSLPIVTIKGKSIYGMGEKISLLTYENYITLTEREISSSRIDSSGNFSFSFYSTHIRYVIIKINYIKKSFVIEPGKDYNVDISSSLTLTPEQVNSPQVSDFITLTIHSDALNQKLSELNEVYANFIVTNSLQLTARSGKTELDTFEQKLAEQFANYQNPFFQESLNYKLATLKFLTKSLSKNQIAKSYFINKPILYLNPDYMDFFEQFFSTYLIHFPYKTDLGQSLTELINTHADFDRINYLLFQDPLLSNDTLRELVLLNGLFEIYYHKDINKNAVVELIHYLEACAFYKEHRNIAESLSTLFLSSTQAPYFNLPSPDGTRIDINHFKGKYIYLNFWKSEIPECTMEFDIMNQYYEKCKDKIAFVSICVDSDPEKMKKYLSQHLYSWTFLYYEKQFTILDNYKVRSFPSYILINPNGYVLTFSASRPTEKFPEMLSQIMNEN